MESLGRVGMVLETGFPPDARVEREALALIEAGYTVYLLCRKYENLPEEEVYKGIHIQRVDPAQVCLQWRVPFTRYKIKTRLLHRGVGRNIIRKLTGMETDWKHLIQQFIQRNQINILHVHDLKLLKTALAASQKQPSIRLVADLHENYPALVGQLTQIKKGKAKGLKKQAWWEQTEEKVLPKAHKILVVVEEAQQRLLKYPTLSPQKINIVRNVVDVEKFLATQAHPLTSTEQALMRDRFILCYVGHINSKHRGIHTVLDAIPMLIEHIPNLLFVGVGSIRKPYLNEVLNPLIEKHKLTGYVHFTGFRDETQFIPYIQQADICLCPHLKTALTDTTFPNKVFLYSLFKKPVIVSSCKPLKRYVSMTESGLAFQANNKSDLSQTVQLLYQNPQLMTEFGHNGQKWVLEQYCWEKEKQNLLQAYQTL